MECRDRVDELERYAIARHHKSDPESRGLCFQATLTLAEEARRLNLEGRVGFVRWSVRGDQAFLEHWALVLDGVKVLDMTAVQVDGNPEPSRLLASYPANYVRPRQYPVTVVLDVMEHHLSSTGRNFARRLLWTLHLALFRHDAGRAFKARSLLASIDCIAELVRRGVTLCTSYVLDRAIARLSRILMRIE
jgi:hypothetical protein